MNLDALRNLAKNYDQKDSLSALRDEFEFPQHEGRDVVYLCGNSLGLLPKRSRRAVEQEFEDWKTYGVEGHFEAKHPWFGYHNELRAPLSRLVGAKESEVVCMNSLTVNVHLLLASFYQPRSSRTKILIVGNEFPSDRYAVESQVRWHGLDPQTTIIEAQPRPGELCLHTQDVVDLINSLGDSLALVHFSAVHYYTGQFFDIPTITQAAHNNGAYCGWDLAHAIGNVPLELHNWNVDYAAWCSYKYLNSGPGGVGGAYVHQGHCTNPDLVRLAGWWGNDPSTRFTMPQWFSPVASADSWQLSNAPVFSMAIHRASLEIFDSVGMKALREKSQALSGFLMQGLEIYANAHPQLRLNVISPAASHDRGAQVSTTAQHDGRKIFDYLSAHGIVSDWRNPDVIRVAPAPLYCRFDDVVRFIDALFNYAEEHS